MHCFAGLSRSVAVTLAYLMRREGISLGTAYARVQALRGGIAPNLGFMGQLQAFESAERAYTSPMLNLGFR